MPKTPVLTSRQAALVGIMAAVYYVLLWLPGIPCIGIPQVKMQVGASFAPIMGIILGPYLGALAAFIGDVIKSVTPPSIYSIPFILCPVLSALNAGFIVRGYWRRALAVLGGILIASMFTPVFNPVTRYWKVYLLAFFDKMIALALIPVVAVILKRVFEEKSKTSRLSYIALFLALFIGIASDKAFGCFSFSLPIVYKDVFGVPNASVARGLFTVSPFIYPIEYVLETILAYFIAIPLLKILVRVSYMREFLKLKSLEGVV